MTVTYASDASSETRVDPEALRMGKLGNFRVMNGVEYESGDDEDDEGFETHQMIHFARVLGEKWACPRPGHNICVPTEHGGHHELSDDDITGWVTALCAGEATTSQPPLSLLLSFARPVSSSSSLPPHSDSISPSHSPTPHPHSSSPVQFNTAIFSQPLSQPQSQPPSQTSSQPQPQSGPYIPYTQGLRVVSSPHAHTNGSRDKGKGKDNDRDKNPRIADDSTSPPPTPPPKSPPRSTAKSVASSSSSSTLSGSIGSNGSTGYTTTAKTDSGYGSSKSNGTGTGTRSPIADPATAPVSGSTGSPGSGFAAAPAGAITHPYAQAEHSIANAPLSPSKSNRPTVRPSAAPASSSHGTGNANGSRAVNAASHNSPLKSNPTPGLSGSFGTPSRTPNSIAPPSTPPKPAPAPTAAAFYAASQSHSSGTGAGIGSSFTRTVWSPYASFLPSIADAEGEEDEDEDGGGGESVGGGNEHGHTDGFSIREIAESERTANSAPTATHSNTPNAPHATPNAPNTTTNATNNTSPPRRASSPPPNGSGFSIHSLPAPSSHGSFRSEFYYDATGGKGGGGGGTTSSSPCSSLHGHERSGSASLSLGSGLGLGRVGSDGRGSRGEGRERERDKGRGAGTQSRAQGRGGVFKAQGGKGGVKSPLKWLEAKGATTIQTATIAKRANAHVARIKKWQKRAAGGGGSSGIGWGSKKNAGSGLRLGKEEREKVSEMMGDALEMARQHHPPRIHKLAYAIGRDVQQFLTQALQSEEAYEDGSDADLALLLIQVQICLIPIVLNRIGPSDPAAAALAHELITALTRSPLDADDIDSELDPDMAAVTIRLVARELAHESPPPPPSSPILPPPVKGIWAGAPGTLAMSATSTASADGFDGDGVSSQHCTRQHTWLGVDLLRIVEMVVGLRMLTEGEQVAIWELALRRKGQTNFDTSRPWEVALFGLCASQNPWFKDAVLGPAGLESLLTALDRMLAPSIPLLDVNWENVALTLRALAFLSEHDWVAKAVEDSIVGTLLGVFRRSIPERWFCIRFWAMDTIRNILSHRPPLVSILVRENAAVAFATLASPSHAPRSPRSPSASNSSFSSSNGIPASSTRNNPSAGMGHSNTSPKTRWRLMDDYKREASKRAEELTTYIRNWTEWKPYLVKLEPVSIGGTF